MAAMSTSVMAKSENPSICIPFVFPNITWQRVKGIFEEIGLGEVERVDMVRKTAKNGKPCKRAFVHFTKWGTSADAIKFRTDILQGKQVKVVYDEPWFWLCAKSNVPRPERKQATPASKHVPRAPPRIEAVSPPGGEPLTMEQKLAKFEKIIADQEKLITTMMLARSEELGTGAVTPEYTMTPPRTSSMPMPQFPPALVRSHAVCCSPKEADDDAESCLEVEIPDEVRFAARQLTFNTEADDDAESWPDVEIQDEDVKCARQLTFEGEDGVEGVLSGEGAMSPEDEWGDVVREE